MSNSTTQYIAILRGINVSGHRLIKMDQLKQMITTLGFHQVSTYIQSGNIVFSTVKKESSIIAEIISTKILEQFSFEVPTIVLLKEEMEQIIKSNPFLKDPKKDPSFFYITLLSEKPNPKLYDLLKAEKNQPDEFILEGSTIYLYCPNGYGKTKLTNGFFEKKLNVMATTRNWKTINELLKIAKHSS
ncbi:MAG TPA: DUF1697 domain-containing protein [Saprospiraceae bacterium]|nr:DUF1697 domain-containing protein [Saprospiraceae bacterium]